MIINGLAEALLTTPEWLTGLSEDKEYDSRTLCAKDLEEHIKKYIDTVSTVVNGEPHQQLLTTFLGKMIDLYSVLCYHFSDAMAEVDRVAEDEGLKQSSADMRLNQERLQSEFTIKRWKHRLRI